VKRAGRIRGDEFDDDVLAGARVAPSVSIALAQHAGNHLLTCGRFQPNVDETRTRHLRLFNRVIERRRQRVGNCLRKLTRIASGRLGEHKCHVGRVVAVGGIARPLDDDRHIGGLRNFCGDDSGDG